MEANLNSDYVLLVSVIMFLLQPLIQQNHFTLICGYYKLIIKIALLIPILTK